MCLASVYPPRAKELKRIIVPLINSWYKWNVTPASETQGTCVLETPLFKQIRKNIKQDSLNTTSISKRKSDLVNVVNRQQTMNSQEFNLKEYSKAELHRKHCWLYVLEFYESKPWHAAKTARLSGGLKSFHSPRTLCIGDHHPASLKSIRMHCVDTQRCNRATSLCKTSVCTRGRRNYPISTDSAASNGL